MIPLDLQHLAYERELQHGVVTYRQLVAGGWTWPRIRTAVRQRRLRRVLPEVYVDHTGPLTPSQRAWAAVLHAEPAALCLSSADDLSSVPVHVAVDRGRRPTTAGGIEIHRVTGLAGQVHAFAQPPRLTFEHNLLMWIGQADDEETVVGLLADNVGRRGVTAAGVRRAIELHPRLRRKRLVLALLADIESGIESVLEHGFLTRVERRHGLPAPVRQRSRPNGERRDGEYPRWGVVVELDGRLNHASWEAGNRDARRDLADHADGRIVLRLRWHQVMVDSCATAAAVAAILQRRGWNGTPRPCGPACAVNSGSVTVSP